MEPSTHCESSGHIDGRTDRPPAPSTKEAVQPSNRIGRPAAIDALRRAERLAAGTQHHAKIASLRLTLEAEQRLEQGVADRTLLKKALELDRDNERAQKLSLRFERGDPAGQRENTRYTAAITIGLVSLLGIAWVLLRRTPAVAPASELAPASEPAPAEASTAPD